MVPFTARSARPRGARNVNAGENAVVEAKSAENTKAKIAVRLRSCMVRTWTRDASVNEETWRFFGRQMEDEEPRGRRRVERRFNPM